MHIYSVQVIVKGEKESVDLKFQNLKSFGQKSRNENKIGSFLSCKLLKSTTTTYAMFYSPNRL